MSDLVEEPGTHRGQAAPKLGAASMLRRCRVISVLG